MGRPELSPLRRTTLSGVRIALDSSEAPPATPEANVSQSEGRDVGRTRTPRTANALVTDSVPELDQAPRKEELSLDLSVDHNAPGWETSGLLS